MPRIVFCTIFLLLTAAGCNERAETPERPALCSQAWFEYVESEIATGDGIGHGPDIGSDEWKSTIEFKLGVRGQADLPDRSSVAWCQFVNEFLKR